VTAPPLSRVPKILINLSIPCANTCRSFLYLYTILTINHLPQILGVSPLFHVFFVKGKTRKQDNAFNQYHLQAMHLRRRSHLICIYICVCVYPHFLDYSWTTCEVSYYWLSNIHFLRERITMANLGENCLHYLVNYLYYVTF